MSHPTGARITVQEILDHMVDRPGGVLYPASIVATIVGVIAFAVGVLGSPERAWTALTWNWALWSGVSIGGGILVAASTIAGGRWISSLRRISESMTAFLPVSYVIMVVLFFGIGYVYPWVEHPVEIKQAYLNPGFFMLRQAIGVAILYLLVGRLVYFSLRPDAGRLRDRVEGWRGRLYARISKNWQGQDIERERAIRRRERLAPAVALLYAALWTVWAWDWMMSIDPHWFSTLYGAWIFMTHFLAGIGATALLAIMVRRSGSFGDVIDANALHDIGKMLFAFTVFWTYLFFAQYLVIWYGRLPEETLFIEERIWHVYKPVATAVLLAVFLIPFFGLLGAKPKKMPLTLGLFATISLIGLWLFHLLIIGPGVFPERIALGAVEVGIAVGMAGLWLLSVLTFHRAFPIVAIADGVEIDIVAEDEARLNEPHQA